MNNLNSVLIEGKIISEPEYSENKVTIKVASTRYTKTGEPEVTTVEILISPKITISNGRDVRVVGRLANNSTGSLFIVCEHIEIRRCNKD